MRHRRDKVKCNESREVTVGDLVMQSSISSRVALKVTKIYLETVDALYEGESKPFQFYQVRKDSLIFWDEESQNKIKRLRERRGELEERIREINQTIESIKESFVGCE